MGPAARSNFVIGRLRKVLAARLSAVSEAFGVPELLARDAPGGLAAPDWRSANRHCRLLKASDGWLALNIARDEDREMLPALIGGDGNPSWEQVAEVVAHESASRFRDRAIELQLPVAVLGETCAAPLRPVAYGAVPGQVIDLSALWAGPLCAGLLGRIGADVLRIESLGRPDPTSWASPKLDRRINGGKRRLALDLSRPSDRACLMEKLATADVLVTSARPAALARLGLTEQALRKACPGLCWVAITAHGFFGAGAARVGFGDDCAVSGGLVRWEQGRPRFFGDALADPLTGIEAALAVLGRDGPGMIDMAMARVAASYSAEIGR